MLETFKSDYASILKVSLFATIVGVVAYLVFIEVVISIGTARYIKHHAIYSSTKN